MKQEEKQAPCEILSFWFVWCLLHWGNQAKRCSCIWGISDPPLIASHTWGIWDTPQEPWKLPQDCSIGGGGSGSLPSSAPSKRMSSWATPLKKPTTLAIPLGDLPLVATGSASNPAEDWPFSSYFSILCFTCLETKPNKLTRKSENKNAYIWIQE